jgi:predicted ATPase
VIVKGKSEPVRAFRLIEARPTTAGISRRLDSALIGRETEVESIAESLRRAMTSRSCEVVTVSGEPGVGKSRLLAEVIARVRGQAAVLHGSCLSYGEGITSWPLARRRTLSSQP